MPDVCKPSALGAEQRLVVARMPSELVRDVVERLVELDGPGHQPAERDFVYSVPSGLRGAVGPLQLRRIDAPGSCRACGSSIPSPSGC